MSNKSHSRPLPDIASWQPRDASRPLSAALEKQCQNAEERILLSLAHEKDASVDHFESGVPFEELIRQEFKRLLPSRYTIGSGLILDRDGKTAGKCDIVLFNSLWFSPVKSPIATEAGQPYIPIEGVYAVGEIKQTISAASLDKAMEKLVICHRLNRPRTFAHRLVENRESDDCPHGLTNPLFSFIVAGSVAKSETFQSIIERFFDINKQLKRLNIIRCLCVLGKGIVLWGLRNPMNPNEILPALFIKSDLFHPIFPVYIPSQYKNSFFGLISHLQQSLFHTILAPEDVSIAYSSLNNQINTPSNPNIVIQPDEEWLDILRFPCKADHN